MAGIEKSDSSSINYIYWNKFGWGVFFYFFGADSRSCAHSFSKRLKSRCMSYSSFVNEQSVELHDSWLESGGSVSPRDPALPARSRADSVVQTVTVHQRCASRSAHQLGVRHLEMIYPPPLHLYRWLRSEHFIRGTIREWMNLDIVLTWCHPLSLPIVPQTTQKRPHCTDPSPKQDREETPRRAVLITCELEGWVWGKAKWEWQ